MVRSSNNNNHRKFDQNYFQLRLIIYLLLKSWLYPARPAKIKNLGTNYYKTLAAMISHNISNLKPEIVGGYNVSSMRALFDKDDKNIITVSNRQLFYYSIETCQQVGKASIEPSKLTSNESIVACERFDVSLYVFTCTGKLFIWNLETRDWVNELTLPITKQETLVSCKILSKRQYIYSVLDNATNKVTLYFSMSKSERERPKQRDVIGECSSGEQNTFDVGSLFSQADLAQDTGTEDADKMMKQRCLVYIKNNYIHFQKAAIDEKLSEDKSRLVIKDHDFTCVRANPRKPMVAAGDSLGRIYLYTGDYGKLKLNRTKLHWHTLPVSDLCFSSTGGTLFSVGGESGCVVVWDITHSNLGKKRVYARLGMPIRFVNCSNILNQLVLSFEDNEIQFMDTNGQTKNLSTFTRRTIDMYRKNDFKALRATPGNSKVDEEKSIGLLWHSLTDTVVTNGKTGWLQFYSPKLQSRFQNLNFLKSNVLSLEKEAKVIPSDITRATLTLDGEWLAFYETRESEHSFPDVKLHIWQRSSTTNRWVWIQTADRLHSSTSIADLKYSPDGQFLISVSEDGTFHVLHRVCLDAKLNTNSRSKQMYAKGFVGNVPEKLPAMATFSQDSSVMAMSLKNDTTLIWMIVDPFKLVYECQLNQIETETESQNGDEDTTNAQPSHKVLGLHFGYHKPSQSLAPLCEIRSNSIMIWNILNSQETMEYSANDPAHDDGEGEFTAAAFDQCPGDSRSLDHFAVSTKKNQILIFRLQISQTTRNLRPLVIVDASLPYSSLEVPLFYTHLCFLSNPILDIDPQCHKDDQIVELLNRLCLMNNYQELISITDKLTLERESANNNCNAIKTVDVSELQAYFVRNISTYSEETKELSDPNKNSNIISEKQRRIRNRLEVQKMLKDLLVRIPSQNLPKMEILGPMILDKLT